jgi:hypothetical protein
MALDLLLEEGALAPVVVGQAPPQLAHRTRIPERAFAATAKQR